MTVLIAIITIATAIGLATANETEWLAGAAFVSFIYVLIVGMLVLGGSTVVDRDLHTTEEGYVVEVEEYECRGDGISNWLVFNFCFDDGTRTNLITDTDGSLITVDR